jgi:hypothetical protein
MATLGREENFSGRFCVLAENCGTVKAFFGNGTNQEQPRKVHSIDTPRCLTTECKVEVPVNLCFFFLIKDPQFCSFVI